MLYMKSKSNFSTFRQLTMQGLNQCFITFRSVRKIIYYITLLLIIFVNEQIYTSVMKLGLGLKLFEPDFTNAHLALVWSIVKKMTVFWLFGPCLPFSFPNPPNSSYTNRHLT